MHASPVSFKIELDKLSRLNQDSKLAKTLTTLLEDSMACCYDPQIWSNSILLVLILALSKRDG